MRLYADLNGESHFEEVAVDLTATEFDAGAPPVDLSVSAAATQFAFMRAPAGWSSNWHPSGARNLFFVLSGEWEVTASDGETRRFCAGATLLVEDTIGKGHVSRVVSESESLAAVLQLPD